jgi:translocation and assembly module TamA
VRRLCSFLRSIAALLLAFGSGVGAHSVAAQDSSKVKVQIEGIKAPLERNVRAVMRLARAEDEGLLPKAELRRLYQRSENDIRLALEPFGFYQPVVESSFADSGTVARAHYVIDPGPAVKVTKVTITLVGPGKNSAEFVKAVERFPVHEGDTLHHVSYEAGKLALLRLASDSGYLDARFDTSAVLVNREAGTAIVDLRFDTGSRFKFGPVRFEQKILDDAVLRRRIPFRSGQFWNQGRLLELQTALAEDPYWLRVEVMPQRREANDSLEVPIRVVLEPRRRRAFEFGLGYGTDTGPRGRFNANLRWVNRKGHTVTTEFVASTLQQSADVRYIIPAFGHPTGNLTVEAGYARLVPNTSTSDVLTGGLKLDRHRLDWRQAVSLIYQRESFTVGVDTGVSNLLIAGLTMERSHADDKLFAGRGFKATIDIQGSEKALFGTSSFLLARATGKVVYRFAPKFRVLARGEIGHIFSTEFRSLPPTLRFFAGGDQSVRGFGYLQLGPTDSLGHVIGGRALLVTSAEVDYQILNRWLVAAFTDYGNATDRFTLTGLEQSAGLGVRFLAPIGFLRLDVAFPVSRTGLAPRLHFSIGSDL